MAKTFNKFSWFWKSDKETISRALVGAHLSDLHADVCSPQDTQPTLVSPLPGEACFTGSGSALPTRHKYGSLAFQQPAARTVESVTKRLSLSLPGAVHSPPINLFG